MPAPLTGLLVSPEAAARHVIAVMIDDLSHARPQSGFNSASIVWQAPAEGGIPRYMMLFQDTIPRRRRPGAQLARVLHRVGGRMERDVRPRRRLAAGAPDARGQGPRRVVYNADEFRWGGGRYLWRTTDRFAPHNVYTDGEHLRALAKRRRGEGRAMKPAWTFAPDAALSSGPTAAAIEVAYPYNEIIAYRYDRTTNTYLRYLNGSKSRSWTGSTASVVAPKNVVILRMRFGPLNDGHPQKHRLEANDVGKGVAYIATNGHTIKGPVAEGLADGADAAVRRRTATRSCSPQGRRSCRSSRCPTRSRSRMGSHRRRRSGPRRRSGTTSSPTGRGRRPPRRPARVPRRRPTTTRRADPLGSGLPRARRRVDARIGPGRPAAPSARRVAIARLHEDPGARPTTSGSAPTARRDDRHPGGERVEGGQARIVIRAAGMTHGARLAHELRRAARAAARARRPGPRAPPRGRRPSERGAIVGRGADDQNTRRPRAAAAGRPRGAARRRAIRKARAAGSPGPGGRRTGPQ